MMCLSALLFFDMSHELGFEGTSELYCEMVVGYIDMTWAFSQELGLGTLIF